jgi:hypothetical protein
MLVFGILGCKAYALDTTLLEMRNEVFEESKKIKPLLADSKDIVLVNSMWDSCIITMTQLDAYFTILSVFNTIKNEDLTKEAINYLVLWLNQIKSTNELNIKSLNAITQKIEPDTEVHMAVLKVYYKKLNEQIVSELDKISLVEESLTVKKVEEEVKEEIKAKEKAKEKVKE